MPVTSVMISKKIPIKATTSSSENGTKEESQERKAEMCGYNNKA